MSITLHWNARASQKTIAALHGNARVHRKTTAALHGNTRVDWKMSAALHRSDHQNHQISATLHWSAPRIRNAAWERSAKTQNECHAAWEPVVFNIQPPNVPSGIQRCSKPCEIVCFRHLAEPHWSRQVSTPKK